ncbi:histidine phosphatase family protein [Halocatena halophila]|uniref:histidine phosphatase family protein n=1 Tax=Halocatena halophila TaxID=2814576 RepID=UPI002ED4823F
MATVLLLRHGRTAWNANRQLQGWAPVQLDDRGREQARNVGTFLASTDRYAVDRIVHSDLARTQETTALITASLSVPTRADSAFRERDMGVYQGLSYDDVDERFPAFALGRSGVDAADRTPESGESYRALQSRVREGWNDLLASLDPEECVLLVSHGGPIKTILGEIQSQPLENALVEGSPRNCALCEIAVESEPTIVRRDVRPWE